MNEWKYAFNVGSLNLKLTLEGNPAARFELFDSSGEPIEDAEPPNSVSDIVDLHIHDLQNQINAMSFAITKLRQWQRCVKEEK